MNLDKIEKLVKIIEESSLQEFSIQEGDIKIKMSKRAGESVAVPFAPGMGMPVAGTAAPEAATADETSGECILEAMKLMNEIESDFDCEIEAVLVSNEQRVEYGQPLFKVKKLDD